MSTEGNDPRGRGRGFFRSRRRPAAPEERSPARARSADHPAATPPPESPDHPDGGRSPETPPSPSAPPDDPRAGDDAEAAVPRTPAESSGEIPMTGAPCRGRHPRRDVAPTPPPGGSDQWTEQPADAEIPEKRAPSLRMNLWMR